MSANPVDIIYPDSSTFFTAPTAIIRNLKTTWKSKGKFDKVVLIYASNRHTKIIYIQVTQYLHYLSFSFRPSVSSPGMGNTYTSCLKPKVKENIKATVIFWGGVTRILNDSQPAGKLMFEFPDRLVCNANSFFIGKHIPVLSIGDDLVIGETYFVIPADLLSSSQILTPALIASLWGPKNKPINFGENSFEYVKNANGETMIKVSLEFLIKLNNGIGGATDMEDGDGELVLCSTPELKKHYNQLVRPTTPIWSPKLETISEKEKKKKSLRLSPIRLSSPIRLLVK